MHAEKGKPGQYVGKVDPNSPAELAGLREGDRILEVNDIDIGAETHKQVVERIKAVPNETTLLVLDTNPTSPVKIQPQTNGNGSHHVNNNNNDMEIKKENESKPEIEKNDEKENEEKKSVNHSDVATTTITTTIISEAEKDSKVEEIPIMQNNNKEMNEKEMESNSSVSTNNNETAKISPTMASNNHHSMSETNHKTQTNGTSHMKDTTKMENNENHNNKNGAESTGGLNLKMTAAELRAKLMAKKKYDPKNESIDLRKKYDIIEKM